MERFDFVGAKLAPLLEEASSASCSVTQYSVVYYATEESGAPASNS